MTTVSLSLEGRRLRGFATMALVASGALAQVACASSGAGPQDGNPPSDASGPRLTEGGTAPSSGSEGGVPAQPDGPDSPFPSSAAESGAGETGPADIEAGTCVTGQVRPNEVVMLGDSYMDPNFGNIGPTLMMDANATYRPYYLGGASMNGGSGQFNIPYQFYNMALPASTDIKVIIMDGGGNDILLNNRQCLTIPVMGDTSCHMVISDVLAKAHQLLADMPNQGVEHIVYLFYPHIDTTTIYTGPNANDWLDYAYPLVAQTCCGANAPDPSVADSTCHGTPVPGLDCTFIDTRPEFAGHNDPTMQSEYWLDAFGIHPNKQGAQVIALKMWGQMQKYCIAQ